MISRRARSDQGDIPATTRRTALLIIGMIGGNLPDADIVWTGFGSGADNLSYLLEHRGYTHTLIGCTILAGLLYAVTLGILKLRGHRTSPHDRWLLALSTLISVFLHICMDTLNSYGVHPFWPIDNRWYYGDAVFIVEPLYWLATAPLLFGLRTLAARIVLGLILLIGSGVILFFHRFALPWWIVVGVAIAVVFAGRRMTPRAAATSSFALMLSVTLGFVLTSRVVEQRVRAIAEQQYPTFQTMDVVMSPVPVYPLCWDILLVQRGEQNFAVRRGQYALAGAAGAASCPLVFEGSGTAPMTLPATVDIDGMHWTGDFTMPLVAFNQVIRADCRARELMQFNRAPFAVANGTGWIVGDLRFDREREVGMAEIEIAANETPDCEHNVPWLPPRADLLQ